MGNFKTPVIKWTVGINPSSGQTQGGHLIKWSEIYWIYFSYCEENINIKYVKRGSLDYIQRALFKSAVLNKYTLEYNEGGGREEGRKRREEEREEERREGGREEGRAKGGKDEGRVKDGKCFNSEKTWRRRRENEIVGLFAFNFGKFFMEGPPHKMSW